MHMSLHGNTLTHNLQVLEVYFALHSAYKANATPIAMTPMNKKIAVK